MGPKLVLNKENNVKGPVFVLTTITEARQNKYIKMERQNDNNKVE